MGGEWRARPLAEVAEIFDGPHATPAKTESGPVFLGISNLANGRVDLSNTEHLSVEDYVRWTRRVQPKAGDVVFSYETRLGEAARVPEGLRCCLGRRMGLLRARQDQVDERFLLYAYLGPQFQELLRSRTIPGSTVDRIPLVDMPSFPILLPSDRNEQRAIAHILGTLDDKIEVNRRMSATLEAMARALFKSWFVDFDPVRAKAEGHDVSSGLSGTASAPGGLPPHLAALFPPGWSEEGELPEGWSQKPLSEIADFLNGLALQKYPASDPADSLPVIKIAELRNGVSAKTDRASRDVPDKYVVRDGDFLFSWSGSLLAKFWTEGEGALNQHLFKVTSERYPAWFFAEWVQVHLEEFQRIAAFKATTMGHIQRSHLQAAMTNCPADDAIAGLGPSIAPLVDRTIQIDLESRTLAAVRDTLLPKLISGEIRVQDAERALASAPV